MKLTKTMLIGIATLIATWLFLTTVLWLCAEFATFRHFLTHQAMFWGMLFIGWIPAVIVAGEYYENYG